jgi:hypothetical protein
MTVPYAAGICDIMTGNVHTTQYNEDNPFRQGNMLPVASEGSHIKELTSTGQIPAELNGMFVRNGTNQRYAPTGNSSRIEQRRLLPAATGGCLVVLLALLIMSSHSVH